MKVLLLTYKIVNGQPPSYLFDLLKPIKTLCSQNTRLLSVSGPQGYFYRASFLWNNLLMDISLILLKSKLKPNLLPWLQLVTSSFINLLAASLSVSVYKPRPANKDIINLKPLLLNNPLLFVSHKHCCVPLCLCVSPPWDLASPLVSLSLSVCFILLSDWMMCFSSVQCFLLINDHSDLLLCFY